jgi:predicted dehydrogenase
MTRRAFLENTCLTAAASSLASASPALASDLPKAGKPLKRTRCAAIGSTGRGGFGHGLDRVFVDLPGVEFVAIADDDRAGLKAAGERTGVKRRYTDYRALLKKEKLDVVCVATRQVTLHAEMVVACANAGKHIYCEKPLAPDLAAADRMLQACEKNGVKIAVALPNRASLAIRRAVEMVRAGRLGRLLSFRARAKEDRWSGGENLLVLGYHFLDLMCLFGGYPEWTFAQVKQDGRDVVKGDTRPTSEPLGPVAGDTIAAMYGFPKDVHGYFESPPNLRRSPERFSMEIYGEAGMITSRSVRDVMLFEGPILNPAKAHQWKPITTDEWDAVRDKGHWCSQQLVLDLLRSIEEDQELYSSGKNARWVLEMVQSVYASHLAKARVPLPLTERAHPLS